MTRRAFVMPIVLLLSMTIGVVAGIILSRASQRAGVVREQLDGYAATHRERGVKEIAHAWIRYSSDQDPLEMTGGGMGGGEAFLAQLGAGESISVSLEPGQATARIDPVGLNVSDGLAARNVETILRDRFGEQGLASRTRTVGPIAIDTQRATDDVIAALAEAVLDSAELANQFASQLRQRITDDGMNVNAVRQAARAVGIERPIEDRLAMLFGVPPTLWRVRATWSKADPRAPGGVRREIFEGVIDLATDAQAGFGAQHPNEMFLEWGRVEEAEGYTVSFSQDGRPGA